MRAIDIRFNLEFVGLKPGVSTYSVSSKQHAMKNMSHESIKNTMSINGGCVTRFSGEKFIRQCDTERRNCRKCWNQEIE